MNFPSKTSTRGDATLLAEDVDRLLEEHLTQPAVQLAPSSGFVHSVMESIHAQASAPAPLVFSRRYLLTGTVAIACGLVAFVIYAVRGGATLEQTFEAALQTHLSLSLTPGQVMLCWIWLATFISITAIAASFRITGNNE